MSFDRTEATGVGVAVAAHLALLAALSLGLAAGGRAPPVKAMEVSFVDEAALESAAPASEPAAQSFAPETGRPEEAAPAPAEQPVVEPQPRPIPQPAHRQAAPAPQPQRAAPAPPRPAQSAARRPQQQSGSGAAQADRGSRLGPDLLKGIGSDSASRSQRPSGAVMSAQAQADIASLIVRQVQPCANRQRSPGPGAERIVVTIRLRLNRDGSLAAPPAVVGNTADDSNRRYLERVTDNAIATFAGCSPLRGLPAELYDVPRGWRDFRLRYRLPG